jgi:hypothetical protein
MMETIRPQRSPSGPKRGLTPGDPRGATVFPDSNGSGFIAATPSMWTAAPLPTSVMLQRIRRQGDAKEYQRVEET